MLTTLVKLFTSPLILDGIRLPQLTLGQVNSPLNVVSNVEEKTLQNDVA